jgi:ribosomal protein S18 acetylase RimI-like enzyme
MRAHASPEVHIREARRTDRAVITQLLETLQDDMATIDPEHRMVRAAAYGRVSTRQLYADLRKHDGLLLVAERSGAPVGLLAGWVAAVSPIDRLQSLPYRTGFVSEIVVLPGHRGRGIGSRLLKEGERRFIAEGCDSVSLYVFGPNRGARRLYLRRGYRLHSLRLGKRIGPPPADWPAPKSKAVRRRRRRLPAVRRRSMPG